MSGGAGSGNGLNATPDVVAVFSGVGGVSGAGGGGNGGKISASNLVAAMTSAQHQEMLISILEHLVTLNHELQRTEAAMGVLDFAGKYLKTLDSQTRVKQRWYEKLHEWRKALNIYEKELNTSGGAGSVGGTVVAAQQHAAHAYTLDTASSSSAAAAAAGGARLTDMKIELLMGRVRCLHGLGEWHKLNQSCANLLDAINKSNNIIATTLSSSISNNKTSKDLANESNLSSRSADLCKTYSFISVY